MISDKRRERGMNGNLSKQNPKMQRGRRENHTEDEENGNGCSRLEKAREENTTLQRA